MIRIEEHFLTHEKAKDFRKTTYEAFPPSTYGTTLSIRRDHYAGTWAVIGSRFSEGEVNSWRKAA